MSLIIAPIVAALGIALNFHWYRQRLRRARKDRAYVLYSDFERHHQETAKRFAPGGPWAAMDAGDTMSSDAEKELEQYLQFFVKMDLYRSSGDVTIRDLDKNFSPFPFFTAVHSAAGASMVARHKELFSHVITLYGQWTEFRRKTGKEIPGADTRAAVTMESLVEAHADVPKRKKTSRRGGRTRSGRFQWHPAFHEKLSGEKLVFWRFRFKEAYVQKDVLPQIDKVCARHGVKSYVIYEMLGPHDLLLRSWLPHSGRDAARMKQALHDDVRDVSECQDLVVDEPIRHWWWDGLGGTPRVLTLPKKITSHFPLSPDSLARVTEMANEYNAGTRGVWSLWLNREARYCLRHNVLRWRRIKGGIKFATVIIVVKPEVGDGVPRDHPLAARNLIFSLLESAEHVHDRSLYIGEGFGGPAGSKTLLVLGRVKPRHHLAIREQIIDPVVDNPFVSVQCQTTLTYIGTGPEIMRRSFKDTVALPTPAG